MNSVENMGLHYWDQQRGSRSRVSESNEIIHEEMNSREQRSGQNVVVREWLIRLGLGYAPIHEIDDEVLPMLTLEDLKDMVISAVGSRRKMYSAILKLQKRFSLVHENHCAPTKKNKEWQKKLPVMVLKAEKIMCFKANLEVVDEWPGLPARVKFDPSDIKLLEHLATKIEVRKLIEIFIPTLENDEGICCTHPENLPGSHWSIKIRMMLVNFKPLKKLERPTYFLIEAKLFYFWLSLIPGCYWNGCCCIRILWIGQDLCFELQTRGNQLKDLYKSFVSKYPIVSIEDPFDQDDWEHYAKLTDEIGTQVQIVGDLVLENIESEGLRDHLATFAESLGRARIMIYPPVKSASKLGEALSGLVEVVEKEHETSCTEVYYRKTRRRARTPTFGDGTRGGGKEAKTTEDY